MPHPRYVINVTTTQLVVRPYRCRRCGFSGRAAVHGKGFGSKEGTEAAGKDSREDAVRDADKALALARCPQCGQRETSLVLRFWMAFFVRVAVPIAVVAGAIVIVRKFDAPWTVPALALMLAVGYGRFVIVDMRRRRRAAGAIEFEPEAAVDGDIGT